MLYDPKLEVKTKPSLAGFVAWLELQDARRQYAYWRCNECAIGEYLSSIGTSYIDECGKGRPMIDNLCRWNAATAPTPWTFGAALARARKLLASAEEACGK